MLTFFFCSLRYPTKKEVKEANEAHLNELPGDIISFEAIDFGDKYVLENFMAPKVLNLKVNAQVMLLKNLTSTLVNGSIGIVQEFVKSKNDEKEQAYPKVKFTNGETRVLYYEEWSIEERGMKIHYSYISDALNGLFE